MEYIIFGAAFLAGLWLLTPWARPWSQRPEGEHDDPTR